MSRYLLYQKVRSIKYHFVIRIYGVLTTVNTQVYMNYIMNRIVASFTNRICVHAAGRADRARTAVCWCVPSVPTATTTTASRPKSPPRDSATAGGVPSVRLVRAAA